MLRLSRAQVNSWRLSRHHLDQRTRKGQLERVVSELCGVQAQVLSYAALALWARVEGITFGDVQYALWKKHSIVKTWSMRGTLHLLSADDMPTYVAARKTTLVVKGGHWLMPEVGKDEIKKIARAVRAALDGRVLTREMLADAVVENLGMSRQMRKHMLSGWGNLLQPAAEQGYLCFGPSQGSKVTFVRPDQWIGKWNEPTGPAAWKILLRQFFGTYGPASHHDVGHWWGLRPDKTERLMEYIVDELEEVDFEGEKKWMRREDLDQIANMETTRSLRLLPSWDCYVMFYHPRELFISQENRLKVFRKLEGNAPVLLIDGVAGGVWEMKRKTRLTEVRVRPFGHLTSAQKQQAEDEATSMSKFMGTEIKFTIS